MSAAPSIDSCRGSTAKKVIIILFIFFTYYLHILFERKCGGKQIFQMFLLNLLAISFL